MGTFLCKFCNNLYDAKLSSKRKYCSKDCSNKDRKGKNCKNIIKKIKVICNQCNKIEYVTACRAKTYVCCSVNCLAEYNSIRYSKKITCVCPICTKNFKLKPYRFNRVQSIPCCSKQCSAKLKEITYTGKNNHQFGLKGNLNSSFKGIVTLKKNTNLEDIFIYCPDRPDANISGRVTLHRLIVQENSHLFNSKYFDTYNTYKILKKGIDIHHIDQNHANNNINNLIPLTKKSHIALHNRLKSLSQNIILKLIGVVKQGELLESSEVSNQQPSLISNDFEGSETNNRILIDNAKDSNIDTSALLDNILNIINDYIVRAATITNEIAEIENKEFLC